MALDTLSNKLLSAVGNVKKLNQALADQSNQIAKEKVENGKTQQANNGLSNGSAPNG